MHANFGDDGTSFKDELTNASSLSANLWASLQNSIPTNDKGQLTQTGVLANVKDTDGVEGISQADINADWTAFQASILSGQTDVSREKFIDWAANKTESAYKFGAKQYNKKNLGNNEGDDDNTGGHVGSSMPGVGWVPGEKKQEYRGYIDKFANFQGNYGNWVFDKDEGKYYDSDAKEKVFISAYDVAQKEDAAKGDPAEDFFYSPDSKTQVELNEEQAKGLATWDMLNFENDDNAAAELNDWFGFGSNSSVQFVPYARWHQRGVGIKDAWATNDIMIINPVSGKPYKDENDDVYRFSIDGDQNALQNVIDSINSNPIINPFVKPRTKPTP